MMRMCMQNMHPYLYSAPDTYPTASMYNQRNNMYGYLSQRDYGHDCNPVAVYGSQCTSKFHPY